MTPPPMTAPPVTPDKLLIVGQQMFVSFQSKIEELQQCNSTLRQKVGSLEHIVLAQGKVIDSLARECDERDAIIRQSDNNFSKHLSEIRDLLC